MPITLLLLTLSLSAHAEAPVSRDLAGRWQLLPKESADAEDAFDGKLRRQSAAMPRAASAGDRRRRMDASQDNYWQAVRKVRERRSMKNLRRLGTVYPLIMANRLDIATTADGFEFTYDELLPREVRPNPDGRVYSAKGAELVSDSIGYTLSYWDEDTLVLETDPPDGGRYVERIMLRQSPARLEYHVTVDLRVLEEPVELVRMFAPTKP